MTHILQQDLVRSLDLYILIGSTILAALLSTTFVGYYMRFTWEKTTAGRAVMLMAAAITIRAWVALISRYDDYHSTIDLTHLTSWLISASWIVVAVVFAWCLHQLVSPHQEKSYMPEYINRSHPSLGANVPASPLPGEDPYNVSGPEVDLPQHPLPLTGQDNNDSTEDSI